MPIRDGHRPALELSGPVEKPRAAVLLLHGGREHGTAAPPPWNLPDVRLRLFEGAIRGAIRRSTSQDAVLLGRVRYRFRGWNGERQDAAQDARRALRELELLAGEVPTVLVGHSMGARAALAAAGDPLVRGVVGLAPWCPAGEPVAHLRGRRVVLLHGDKDRTTDPRSSLDFAARAGAAGADAATVLMCGSGHAMLRRATAWHDLTGRAVAGFLGLAELPAVIAEQFPPTSTSR
ncbi:alpha/beta hydrolase [Streptomyces durmitorensis]|uniref:Alpha/beta fold hydrolase n=1 Tax=Streptomyces durmitorensis TaxID=319947 RepID=A0ABY4PP77_9ACTN|nr:alpha/beta fold hydrolase [Streptomyces durmitorensis]UQT54748.1 alpha/beta fold hydrolase [Streptomyces durmitorensis]